MTKKNRLNRRRQTITTELVITDPQQYTTADDNCMQSECVLDGETWMTKSIDGWSIDDVAQWLTQTGFQKYAQLIAYHHQKPLEITCLGDVKRLNKAICSLRELHNQQSIDQSRQHRLHSSSTITKTQTIEDVQMDQKINGSCTNGIILTTAAVAADYTIHRDGQLLVNHHYQSQQIKMTREELIRRVESPDTKEKSLFKLIVAFIYCLCSLLITAFVMVLVHDRVPDMKTYPPLPDIVLDNVPLIPWAFEVCEVIAVSMTTIWFINLFFHKHRIVVMRRMFSLVGTVFLLRCITMMITSLSVPGVHLECRAKSYGTLWQKIVEAYYIWSRLGMSVQGVRSCGDYMFSGHTTVLTLLNHFITEYTPDSWHFLHTSTWVLNLFGIFFILAGHEHYSIDVFIAFYISSRMFLYYHAYAYNHPKLTVADSRMRLWFPLGWFFEAGGCGRVENEYEFPIYIPHPADIGDRIMAVLAMIRRKSRNESTIASSLVLSKKCPTKNGYNNGSIGMNDSVNISKME